MEDVILLDTGILIDFLADRETAGTTEQILTEGKGAVSAISIYELFRCVESEKHLHQRTTLITYLHVLELTSQIARRAGLIYTSLRKRGKLIDNEDILIGATCIYHSISLFTKNTKHFNNLQGLRFIDFDIF